VEGLTCCWNFVVVDFKSFGGGVNPSSFQTPPPFRNDPILYSRNPGLYILSIKLLCVISGDLLPSINSVG
jgi:hypothetical protein